MVTAPETAEIPLKINVKCEKRIMKKSKHHVPARTEEHDAMLKEALARPGVREVMKVFGQWQEQEQMIDFFYWDTTEESSQITNTNHANPQ